MRNFPIALWIAGAFLTLAGAVLPRVAAAQQDAAEEIHLMREPASYTDVIDALDDDNDDPFDLNLSIGFSRVRTAGTIQRESVTSDEFDPDRDRGSQNWADIAEHEHLTNTLMFGLDIGFWHDAMVYARMPLVLSDSRNLRVAEGRTLTDVNTDLTEPNPTGMPAPLFSASFDSPDRSGIPYLAFGAAWSFFNQMRDPAYPTMLLIVEGRFNYGELLRPCDAETDGDSDCGISEGVNGLKLETRASHRYRYIEPYAGLSFEIGWPSPEGDDRFIPSGELAGYMNTLPPRIGTMTFGMAVIPWEHRARWQRFMLDLRFTAAYVSEGHSRSPLFDALGTSDNEYLTTPNRETADGTGREVAFTGLTDTQSHGRFGVQAALEMQAAKYVRFYFGGAMHYATPYLITFTDSCNPNVDPDGDDDPRQGTCRSGIINPHHRPVLDVPGQRFRVEGEITLDLFANAVVQF